MTFKIIMNHFLVTINPFHYGDIAMKKCPVCGVEHSDIVPVCSICGSPLSGGEVTADVKAPASEPVKPVEPVKAEPVPEAPAVEPVADFSDEDILAAVSSVVSSSMKSDAPTEEDADDIDSPFVVNAMKNPSPAAQEVTSPTKANAPKKGYYSKKVGSRVAPKAAAPKKAPEPVAEPAADDVLDTTAIAAASALKVQEAMKNAEAARARQAAEAEAAAEPEQAASSEHSWTERKHKRNQKSTTTPVIAAVCALLALLIVAMLFLLGKMMLDDSGSKKPADDTQQPGVEDDAEPGTEDGDTANDPDAAVDGEDENTDITPEDEILPDAEGDTQQPAEGDEPSDADGDALQPAEGQDDTTDEPDADAAPELPAVTEVNDTVYTTAAVNVRDYPSTDTGAIINTLSSGKAVARTGKTANGWSRVEINGTVGYISDTYLSATKPDASDSSNNDDTSSASTAYITSNGVNLRSEPSGTVLSTLVQDQKVELTGKTSGNWTQVKVNGLTGYVYNTYLSSTKGGSADTSNDDTTTSRDDSDVKVTKVNETVYATAGVNVRDYPSSSDSNVITVLSKGQSVKRTGKTANGWSRIEVGGITGYVYSDYLSTSKNSSDNTDNNSGSGTVVSGYILPKSNSKNYTADELSGLSKSELRLARNEIFARHGRKFSDESLQNYFNSCSWYKGTIDPATFDANVTSYLNSYELANLDLIKSLE